VRGASIFKGRGATVLSSLITRIEEDLAWPVLSPYNHLKRHTTST
jgi:hypothetical protein